MDGKHARRIGASSPLGQLIDHGCDAFSMSFLALFVVSLDGLNEDHMFWGFTKFMSFLHYIVNWTEYHSHVCPLKVGQIGVTEMYVLWMILLIFNGVTGYSLASISIFKGLTVGD